MPTNEKSQKVARQFTCEPCDYICCNKYDYNKHLSTRKHTNAKNACDKPNDLSQKIAKTYTCTGCNREYKHQSSLCKHSKTCDYKRIDVTDTSDVTTLTNLVMELVTNNNELHKQSQELQRQSQDFQKQLLELCKNGTNINNTTNNNQKFNINVFLNEQCKDAINFADFVKNIEVSREDIQNTGQLGFVNGISKIIMDNLKQLGVNERPIHCTDLKRETMYIKDEDKWNKEEDDTKLRNAIQTVSRKSVKTLIDWKQVNPDYEDGDSEFSQECLSMQRHSVAGDDREVYYPKVAKLVAKEVIVDKS